MHQPGDPLGLHALSVSTDRDEFRKPHDTYADWTLLAPISGGFEFVLEAEVQGTDDQVAGTARFGDLVICPPGGTLHRRLLEPSSYLYVSLEQVQDLPTGRTTCTDLDRLRTNYRWLAEFDDDLAMSTETRRAWRLHVVTDLLALLVRSHSRAAPSDSLVTEVVQYIHDHALESDLMVADVADRFGLSPSQLSRRFRATLDATPRSLIRAVRLQHARALLTTTDLSVAQIARRCGYPDQFHFSRVFSQEMGISPSAHRASHLA